MVADMDAYLASLGKENTQKIYGSLMRKGYHNIAFGIFYQ